MKVITADWEEIRRFYRPILGVFDDCLVLSVGAGGTTIFNELKTAHQHVAVSCRRPSSRSGLKKALVSLARRFPEPLRDFFRFIEHKFLMSFESDRREVRFGDVEIARILRFPKIVILDDAIDTGRTIKTISDYLKGAGYKGVILSIVFAWTNVRSCIQPDFWFKESVLVKFPWSKDL
jgi:phosphoribosylpyrophosphate synthetase